MADTTAIKAGREELLWADVYNKHGQQVQWTGMLEPKPGFIEKYQLLVARTLATPDSAQIQTLHVYTRYTSTYTKNKKKSRCTYIHDCKKYSYTNLHVYFYLTTPIDIP